ncbi:MAG: helix-turn-helix domain-containing protein [Clostridium sp.]
MANLLGISELYLGKLERGDKTPSPKLIVRMAKLYRCTTDEIFKDFNITD